MLPREFVEELLGGLRAASFHVLDALLDRLDGLLIVLTLPFEIFGQHFVEGIGGRLSPPPRQPPQLGAPLRPVRHRPPTSQGEPSPSAVHAPSGSPRGDETRARGSDPP